MKDVLAKGFVMSAVAALLAVALFACGSGGVQPSSQEEAPSSSSAATEQAVPLSDAKLVQMTEVLEYSDKTVDPTTLVECTVPEAKVTAKGDIDLKTVGEQDVVFELAADDETEERAVTFKVRDTKPPEIKLEETSVEVEQGATFDPATCLTSVSDPVDGALDRVGEAPAANGKVAGQEQFYDRGWYLFDGAVDTSSPGEYRVTVKASDKHGNEASKSFKVTVVAAPEPEPALTAAEEPEPAAVEAPAAAAPATAHYVLNTNTRKFHRAGCSAINKMKDYNRQDVDMTREDVLNMGYDPCGICHP